MISSFCSNKTHRLWLLLGVSCASAAFAQSAARLKAIELVKEAALVFGRGDMPLVIKICRQALVLDPNYPRAYTYLGAAYQRRGDRQSACNAFNRVVKLAPGSPDAVRAKRGIKELACAFSNTTPLNLRLENRWSAPVGITSLAFATNGIQISSGGADGAWRLWRVPDGRLDRLERGAGFEAGAVASSPNFYALGSGEGKVRFFDAQEGRDAGRLEARSGSVGGLAYSQDGRFLAVSGADGALKIYDGRSNLLLRQIPGDGFLLSGAAFSPDSRFVAAGVGSVVRVYETQSGRLVRVLSGDGLPISAMAWNRGGTLLAGASGYKIRIWNALNGKLARTLSGHRLSISALAFGNGSTLASGGYDAQLRLWNAQNGASMGNFALHGAQIRALSFDRSGKRLASGDQNGLVGLWRLP
jgi:WD40 repeat protein